MRIGVILSVVGLLMAGGVAIVVSKERADNMVDITAKGPSGLPIIFWRIEQDDRKAVRALIAAGVDIEIPGFQQATPAIAAASANAWITTKMLLEMGANMRAVDRQGFTLPWLAQTARMNETAPEGMALVDVKAMLAAQGLMRQIYEPRIVEAMVANGDWPPPGW